MLSPRVPKIIVTISQLSQSTAKHVTLDDQGQGHVQNYFMIQICKKTVQKHWILPVINRKFVSSHKVPKIKPAFRQLLLYPNAQSGHITSK